MNNYPDERNASVIFTFKVVIVFYRVSVVDRRASDRKVDDPWFDSRTGKASLCPWERHFRLVSIGVKQSTRFGGQKIFPRTRKGAMRWCGWIDA